MIGATPLAGTARYRGAMNGVMNGVMIGGTIGETLNAVTTDGMIGGKLARPTAAAAHRADKNVIRGTAMREAVRGATPRTAAGRP